MGCMKFPSWKNYFFFLCECQFSCFYFSDLSPLSTSSWSRFFLILFLTNMICSFPLHCTKRMPFNYSIPFFLLVTWLEHSTLWLWQWVPSSYAMGLLFKFRISSWISSQHSVLMAITFALFELDPNIGPWNFPNLIFLFVVSSIHWRVGS